MSGVRFKTQRHQSYRLHIIIYKAKCSVTSQWLYLLFIYKITLIMFSAFFYIGKNGYLCFGKDNYRQVYIINEKE